MRAASPGAPAVTTRSRRFSAGCAGTGTKLISMPESQFFGQDQTQIIGSSNGRTEDLRRLKVTPVANPGGKVRRHRPGCAAAGACLRQSMSADSEDPVRSTARAARSRRGAPAGRTCGPTGTTQPGSRPRGGGDHDQRLHRAVPVALRLDPADRGAGLSGHLRADRRAADPAGPPGAGRAASPPRRRGRADPSGHVRPDVFSSGALPGASLYPDRVAALAAGLRRRTA